MIEQVFNLGLQCCYFLAESDHKEGSLWVQMLVRLLSGWVTLSDLIRQIVALNLNFFICKMEETTVVTLRILSSIKYIK